MFHVTRDRRERIDGHFEKNVRWLLSHAFTSSHFFTLSETSKYKPSESSDTWRMMKNEVPEVVEVYHKQEFLCDVDTTMTRDQIISKVWKNLELKKEKQKLKEEKKEVKK